MRNKLRNRLTCFLFFLVIFTSSFLHLGNASSLLTTNTSAASLDATSYPSQQFIKAADKIKQLYAISEFSLALKQGNSPEAKVYNNSMRTMTASLQGILAAQNSEEQIYSLEGPEYNDYIKEILINHPTVSIDETYKSNPWGLVKHFYDRGNISGYVLYDGSITNEINSATSASGCLNGITVHASIVNDLANNVGKLSLLDDCRGMTEEIAFEKYWKRLNHTMVVEQKPEITLHLRDYAVMTKSFVFSGYALYSPNPQALCFVHFPRIDPQPNLFPELDQEPPPAARGDRRAIHATSMSVC